MIHIRDIPFSCKKRGFCFSLSYEGIEMTLNDLIARRVLRRSSFVSVACSFGCRHSADVSEKARATIVTLAYQEVTSLQTTRPAGRNPDAHRSEFV